MKRELKDWKRCTHRVSNYLKRARLLRGSYDLAPRSPGEGGGG